MIYVNIPRDQFDPDVIINSGQVFRMYRDGDVYRAVTGSKAVTFRYDLERGCWVFYTDLREWEGYWVGYFDLATDYAAYNRAIRSGGDPLLAEALEATPGMRILKQDLWEAAVTFMVSQNNNIPKIRKTVNLLCERYGASKEDSTGFMYYTFPTAQRIAALSPEEFRDGTMLGYRAEYILEFARRVVDGDFPLSTLEALGYEDALEALKGERGIGEKVSNCITLYGLHLMESYPIDKWMKRIIKEDYPQYTQAQYLGYINETYPGFQGYVQQIQFYHKRKTKKKSFT